MRGCHGPRRGMRTPKHDVHRQAAHQWACTHMMQAQSMQQMCHVISCCALEAFCGQRHAMATGAHGWHGAASPGSVRVAQHKLVHHASVHMYAGGREHRHGEADDLGDVASAPQRRALMSCMLLQDEPHLCQRSGPTATASSRRAAAAGATSKTWRVAALSSCHHLSKKLSHAGTMWFSHDGACQIWAPSKGLRPSLSRMRVYVMLWQTSCPWHAGWQY